LYLVTHKKCFVKDTKKVKKKKIRALLVYRIQNVLEEWSIVVLKVGTHK